MLENRCKVFLKKGVWKLLADERQEIMAGNAKILSTAILHQKTFLPYKNYCGGMRDLAVCGAGPTLNRYQPVDGAVHIAVNRAFLYEKVDFDFIFAQDFEGIKMVQEELIHYRRGKCVKFLGTQCEVKRMIPESLILKAEGLKFDTDHYIHGNGYKGSFVVDIENRALCNMINVGQSVMQLALFMNPRKLYIVGCDMSGNHFAKGNQTEKEATEQGKELEKYWQEERIRLLGRWEEIKQAAEIYYPDTEIISVNPVGLRGVFKDWYQNE